MWFGFVTYVAKLISRHALLFSPVFAALRIRDILVRIRMLFQKFGSVPLTTDPDADPGGLNTYGSGSGTLVHWQHSSKVKSHKEVTKTVFELFCLMMEGSEAGSVFVTNES